MRYYIYYNLKFNRGEYSEKSKEKSFQVPKDCSEMFLSYNRNNRFGAV